MPRFSGNGIDNDFVYVDYSYTQNVGANTSTISWTIGWAFRSPSPTDRDLDNGSLSINGSTRWSNANPYNYTGTFGSRDMDLASGSYTVTHNSSGYKSVNVSASITPWQNPASSFSTTLTLPRIPKTASAPGTPNPGTPSATSVPLSWSAPSDNGGSTITSYTVQYATNSGFTTGTGTQSFSGTSGTVTGLTAGQTYYFRVRAINGQGDGAWSGTRSVAVLLPAPTFTSWVQNASEGLVADWTAPATTTGLTGYRVRVATNAALTENVSDHDFGVVLTGTITGLAGGRLYYASVAALTSAGVNTWSNSRSTMLVLDAGDLDGWSRTGTKPANISYYTTEGLRRGAQSLHLESLSTGAATLAADTFGIERTFTTEVGKAYVFRAQVTGNYTGTPSATQGATYRLAVGATLGDTAELTTATGTIELPEMEFIASSTSTTLKVLLGEALTISGAQNEVEKVAVNTIRLLELDTDYPQRLRSTVYESNLANHFDLACNSVGATWYVAKDGVTRFRLPGALLPVSAVFSDESTPGAVSYVDIVAGYDTRTTVNRIEATNYGVDETGEFEENEALIVEDTASQAAYGVYRSTLEMNLYDVAPYDTTFADRLDDLLAAYSTPAPVVSRIRWNAQEDLELATALEVGQRLHVRYRGSDYNVQIVNISHDISPRRWMVTLDLTQL